MYLVFQLVQLLPELLGGHGLFDGAFEEVLERDLGLGDGSEDHQNHHLKGIFIFFKKGHSFVT